MRVFALSDIHIDHPENMQYIDSLSKEVYKEDILVLAGDVSHDQAQMISAMKLLKDRFKEVFFVPGNHDLWVKENENSFAKFDNIKKELESMGICMRPKQFGLSLAIIPLFSWYDYSFGNPSELLMQVWQDYIRCSWKGGKAEKEITDYFLAMNEAHSMDKSLAKVITFSHFLPRIDIMPSYIPEDKRFVYPVLGSWSLDRQLRGYGAHMHVYGHSHVNVHTEKEGVTYINNAMGYPTEARWLRRELLCIAEV